MYLHRLRISALGPFAGEFTIDFDQVTSQGLFLMEGATGSGKSTLIDAITFALYGQVASSTASLDRLRSDHAAADAATWVELVYSTSSGVYRVWREPAYERAKRSGSGTTKQNASIKLWRLTSVDDLDGGEIVSARIQEAAGEIQRSIGLDKDQFTQTMVLPQGEFASFLRAEGETRRALLQKVFGTGMYERWQIELGERRRVAGATIERARGEVVSAIAHFAGATGAQASAVGPDATDDDLERAVGLAHDVMAVALVNERTTAAHLEAAQAQYRSAGERMQALTDQIAKVRRLIELAHQRRELDDQREVFERDMRALSDARRAAEVRVALDGAAKASADVWSAEGELAQVRDALLLAPEGAGLVAGVLAAAATDPEVGSFEVLTRVREDLTAEFVRLERPQMLERQLAERRAQARQVQDEVERHQTQLAHLREQLEARPAGRADLARRREHHVTAGARVSLLTDQLAARRETLRTTLRADQVRADIRVLALELERATLQAKTAVANEARARMGHLTGLASQLAVELRDGEPCPVCGSLDHPEPAGPASDGPDEAEIERLAEVRAAAESDAADIANRLAESRGTLAALESHGSRFDAEAAQVAVDEGAAALAAAQDSVALAEELTRELQAYDSLTAQLAEQIELRDFEASAKSADAAAMAAAIERDEFEVREALYADAADGGMLYASVGEHRAYVEGQLMWVGRLTDAVSAFVDAQARADERCDILAQELAKQGFANETEARAAQLTSTEMERLEQRALAYQSTRRAVEDEFARLDADPQARADLAELERRLEQAISDTKAADAAREAAAGEARLAMQRAGEAHAALERLTGARASWRTALAQAAPVVRIADIAAATSPDNGRRLSLATYVLMRRFDDVVSAANDRLLAMSDGRYELQRSDEKEDTRARRIGLALTVRDHVTEESRDPRTLSGGETFYVSLCLALGLADVVAAEAGGVELGTLFIDEGFGTLDPTTLEMVLHELTRLRDTGRVIGVVSHVDALKQQISERIEVTRLPGGASTLTVVA